MAADQKVVVVQGAEKSTMVADRQNKKQLVGQGAQA